MLTCFGFTLHAMKGSLIQDATLGASDLHQDLIVFHLVKSLVSPNLFFQIFLQFKTMLGLFLGFSH